MYRKMLLILAADGNVSCWDPATGEQKGQLTGSFRGFSDTGAIVFGEKPSGELEFWDSTTHRLLGTAERHSGPPFSPVFSPDDRFFACTDPNGTVRLWEVATGRLQGALPGPTNSSFDLWFPSRTDGLILAIKRDPLDPNWAEATAHVGVKRGGHGSDPKLSENGFFRFWDAAQPADVDFSGSSNRRGTRSTTEKRSTGAADS